MHVISTVSQKRQRISPRLPVWTASLACAYGCASYHVPTDQSKSCIVCQLGEISPAIRMAPNNGILMRK